MIRATLKKEWQGLINFLKLEKGDGYGICYGWHL